MNQKELIADYLIRMLETSPNSLARFYHQNLSDLKDSLELQDPSNNDFIVALEGLMKICESRFTHCDD
jgi:hypothetical protein